ncbi:MAG TPA: polysaccharide biosynthesis C-terminal domain-containing protein, partial [Rugosimonospora sp.]|nr:polysaccharide biosynthesis C-terminal domain-containing protein [Rugosimonospora sp.]
GVLSDTLLAATRGFRAMRPTVLLDRILRPGTQLLCLAALTLAASRAAGAYAAAWAAPYALSAVLAAVALRQRVPRDAEASEVTGDVEGVDRRTFWRFTGPRAAASVAQLALNRFDILLLAALAGLPAAAVYAVAGRFLTLGQLAGQAINQSVQPRLAERLAVGDADGANRLYRTATAWLVLTAWPLYLGIAVNAPVYLGLFGDGYASGTAVVVVIAAGALVGSGCGMVDIVLAMAGRTTWNLANVLTALAVNVGVDLLLIPRLGALGAAVGLTCALVANNVVPLLQVAFSLGLHPFGRATLVAGGLALACFGGVPLAFALTLGVRPATTVAGAALGALLYALALLRLHRVLHLDALARRPGRHAVPRGARPIPDRRSGWREEHRKEPHADRLQ